MSYPMANEEPSPNLGTYESELSRKRREMKDELGSMPPADTKFMASLLLDKMLHDLDCDDLAQECFDALELAKKKEAEREDVTRVIRSIGR